MKRYLNLNRAGAALLVAASLTLAACGGGGGGGSKKDPTSPSVEAAATGVASKGILKSAAVKAIELDANGRELHVLGEATTKDDGRYSLRIDPNAGYRNGPVLFELTATEDTRMVCDVPTGCDDVAFGEDVQLDKDFKLQAIVPSVESGKTISVQITPFTTMAARRALAGDAVVSAESVNNANSAVSQILGVSVLTTEPADLTKPDNNVRDDAKIYGAFLAGVGTMAMESSGAEGLSEFIDQLATTFEDGSFDPKDPVSIDELVKKVEEATKSTQLFPEGAPALVTQSVATLKDNVKEGSYKPEPSKYANEPALAQAKALVADARTLATSVAELEEPLDAFKGDLEAAEQVFNNDSKALLETVALAVDTVLAAVDKLEADTGPKQLPLYDDEQREVVGQVTANLTEDAHGTRLKIGPLALNSDTKIDLDLALDTSLKLSEVLGEEQFDVREAWLSLQGFTGNDQIRLSLDDVVLRVALRQNVTFDPAPADFVEDAQLQTVSLSGKLTLEHTQNNVSFTGSAEAQFVELEAKAAAPRRTNHGSMKYLHVAGTLSSPNGSFDASVTFDLDNAATFDTLAFLDHQSWVWIHRTVAGDVLGVKKFAAENGINNLRWASYNGDETYIVDDSFVGRRVEGDDLRVRVENYIREHYEHYNALADFYGDIQFSYLWYHYDAETDKNTFSFDIDLGSFENAKRFAKGKLTLALDLDLKGHPATKAIMTVNRSGFDSGDATVTFERPGSKWTVFAKKDDGKDVSSVDVTNPDGVKMTLTRKEESGDVSGTITVDDKKVGDVETASNGLILLRWIDGTFETLY